MRRSRRWWVKAISVSLFGAIFGTATCILMAPGIRPIFPVITGLIFIGTWLYVIHDASRPEAKR